MMLFVYHILPGLPCAIDQFQVVSREDIGNSGNDH